MINRLLPTVVLMITLCGFAGCLGGDSGPEISGNVTLDGSPVENGWVTFYPLKRIGKNAACQIDDGKFSCPIEPAEYRVEIRSGVVVGTEQADDIPGSPTTVDVIEELLPDCYNDKSELTVIAVDGSNQKDFELSSSK